MAQPLTLVHREESGIEIITLNRPDKRNALNIQMMKELCTHFEKANQDHSIRVIILKAEGPVFCAGLDLQEATNASKEEESAQLVAHVLRAILDCPAVTIAAVHGAAIGGGAGLMTAFDFVVAAEGVHISFPEVRRGLVPAHIAVILMRQLAGRHMRELLLLGEAVDAKRALEIGLVTKVAPLAQLQNVALQLAQQVLLGAPGAERKTKKLLDILYPTRLSEDFLKTMPFHIEARQSPEAKEGLQAFLTKREPRW